MLSKNLTVRRNAEVTIEITLSIALSVIVLFLALGLFSSNLSTMAANSGIRRLFNNNSATKTVQQNWGNNPTASQVNVQIVADQGELKTLADYTNWATTIIDQYKDRTDLTPSQQQDLAKAYTIKSMNAGSNSVCDSACTGHGISIQLNSMTGGQTIVNSQKLTYDSYTSVTTSDSPTAMLDTVRDIYSKPFS